jgi:hypothetical protein
MRSNDWLLMFAVVVACAVGATQCSKIDACEKSGGIAVRGFWGWPMCLRGEIERDER